MTMTMTNTNQHDFIDDTKSTGERLLTGYFDRFTIEHLHRYGLATRLAKDMDVLDIACGEGYGSNLLATVAHSVFGVDIDNTAINRATNKYKAQNLKYLVGSASNIPIETASIDLVISFETLEHHDQHQEMYMEIKRVLRPNGILVISTPDKYFFSDLTGHQNAYHVKELYSEEFIELNKKYFKNISLYSQKMKYGSLIAPHSHDNTAFCLLTGDHSKITEHTSIPGPTYHICVASDDELIDFGTSIFDGDRVIIEMDTLIEKYTQDLRQLEKHVNSLEKISFDLKKSASYRLGNTLLWPIKFFLGR